MAKRFKKSDLFGKKFIYTIYNKDDINELADFLVQPLSNGVIPTEKEFNALLTTTANKAGNNFVYFASDKALKKNSTRAVSAFRVKSTYSKSVLSNSLKISDTVFNSYIADIEKTLALGTFEESKAGFVKRAELIASSETARTTNAISQDMAVNNGYNAWVWGSTSSDTPREEHEVLVGEVSHIGDTPAPDGEFPGELANCNCQMIFTTVDWGLF